MIGRIVEVADDQRHLHAYRGFMVVSQSGDGRCELGRIPLDDIVAVIANAHGLSYTNNLLVALAERGTPLVLCAANHNVVGMLLSLDGNYEQARRIEAQITAAKPVHKRLWADVVKSKLEQQAVVLEAVGANSIPLQALVKKVKSGDPENIEAQGARRYWNLLFGTDFRRDQTAGGVNSLLNYGYTVMRSAVARSVVAAGLHPSIGLHHSHAGNAMCLVDDLIEPFRPLVDLRVWLLAKESRVELSSEVKRTLVQLLYEDMSTVSGSTPISVCMQKLAVSLAQVYLGQREKLELPLPNLPIAVKAGLRGSN